MMHFNCLMIRHQIDSQLDTVATDTLSSKLIFVPPYSGRSTFSPTLTEGGMKSPFYNRKQYSGRSCFYFSGKTTSSNISDYQTACADFPTGIAAPARTTPNKTTRKPPTCTAVTPGAATQWTCLLLCVACGLQRTSHLTMHCQWGWLRSF